jgi:hypothetical protein
MNRNKETASAGHVLAILIPVCLIVVGAFAVASPVALSAAAPPCQPKITKIQGKPAAENCGPAKVSLTIGGRTYHFTNGLCTTSGSSAFLLQMGTVVSADPEHNGGLPSFSMTVSGSTGNLTAEYGGKDLIGEGMTLVTVRGSRTNIGTFKNKLPTPKLSGSWNCHGVIYKGP